MTNKNDNYRFEDLVDIVEFEKLLKSFYNATKIPNGIVGNDGEVITQAGWVDACTLFHRKNKDSKLSCEESNITLMKDLSEGKINYQKCKNGLVDYATSIFIEGNKVATVFLGQILDQEPDMNFFESQAEKLNYDKKAYLKAITEVPIVEKEKMEALMDCIVIMAHMLAENGLSKLREKKLTYKLDKTTKKTIHLKDILDFSPIGIGWSNMAGKVEYLNHQFTEIFGYTINDIPTLTTWYEKAYPEENYRKEVLSQWRKKITDTLKKDLVISELEESITCKDGSVKRVFINVTWQNGLQLVSFNDMTAHWKSELRNRAHDGMLEMVAKNLPLVDILYKIVNTIEAEDPTSTCSILLLDKEGKHLLTTAAPNLPAFYNEAIHGLEIGVGVGSCGTAAFRKKRVIVEDIMNHEYWEPYRNLAKKAKIASCWSEPIISTNGKVLGTFAIYHEHPSSPNSNDIDKIHFAANLAAIAIDNRNTHLELEERAYTDYLTNLPNRRYFIEHAELELSRHKRYGVRLCLIMFDIDHFKILNDTYGHSVGDLVLQKIATICKNILRDIDLIGRIGGEEFAILLPHTVLKEAVLIAERLRVAIDEGEIILENKEVLSKFAASFGVVFGNEAQNIDDLLIKSDLALYEAKNSGRNKVCVFKQKN